MKLLRTNYTVTGLTFSTDYTFTVKSKDKANLSKAYFWNFKFSPRLCSKTYIINSFKLDCSSRFYGCCRIQCLQWRWIKYATTSTETNYTVTGLTSSTDYTFTVKSKDKADLSDASDETITTKPSATNLQASTTTSSSTV
jgi:chitodextrinase